MAILEKGRVCIQKRGRTAGKKVVVLGMEKNKVMVVGKHVKKHASNPLHLFPTSEKVAVSANPTKEELEKILA